MNVFTFIRSLTFGLAAVVLPACGHKPETEDEVKIPVNILSEEVFAKVLVDFALAESAINVNVKNIPVMRMDTIYAFDPLNDNGVRKAQYDSTLTFYAGHPDLYKKVYESVLATLSEMQTRRDSLIRKDSALK